MDVLNIINQSKLPPLALATAFIFLTPSISYSSDFDQRNWGPTDTTPKKFINPEEFSPLNNEASPRDVISIKDGEAKFIDRVLTTAELEGGTKIIFTETGGGVGAYEIVPPGAPGLAEFPQLKNASLIDVFLSVTPANTRIPDKISKISKPSKHIGPQGWVNNAITRGHFKLERSSCSNTSFSNAVTSKGYNDRGTPKLRLDKRVGFTSLFVERQECFGTSWQNGCPDFYRYELGGNNGSIFYNVDKYYTRVAICGLGSHPTISTTYGSVWSHPGPILRVSYRDSNNNGWYSTIYEDFATNDIGGVRAWHFWGGAAYRNYDWRTRIEYAKPYDYFDIGHAVEDL